MPAQRPRGSINDVYPSESAQNYLNEVAGNWLFITK